MEPRVRRIARNLDQNGDCAESAQAGQGKAKRSFIAAGTDPGCLISAAAAGDDSSYFMLTKKAKQGICFTPQRGEPRDHQLNSTSARPALPSCSVQFEVPLVFIEPGLHQSTLPSAVKRHPRPLTRSIPSNGATPLGFGLSDPPDSQSRAPEPAPAPQASGPSLQLS